MMPLAGALSALLSPYLRARLGWTPDLDQPPASAYAAIHLRRDAGGGQLTAAERASVAIAVALWSDVRSGVDVVEVASVMDPPALRRLIGFMRAVAVNDGGVAVHAWAERELDPPPDYPPEA